MPESKEVRVLARVVAERLGLVPWHEHRDQVLPVVYKQLGLTKRKRKECSICLDGADLLVLAPCGHKCVCEACSKTIMRTTKKCPMCQGVSMMIMKVF